MCCPARAGKEGLSFIPAAAGCNGRDGLGPVAEVGVVGQIHLEGCNRLHGPVPWHGNRCLRRHPSTGPAAPIQNMVSPRGLCLLDDRFQRHGACPGGTTAVLPICVLGQVGNVDVEQPGRSGNASCCWCMANTSSRALSAADCQGAPNPCSTCEKAMAGMPNRKPSMAAPTVPE